MGRLLLVLRLALRDLRRHPAETALLLLAIAAATTTLTLGLVVRSAANDPYMTTRAATNGPDVASAGFTAADLTAIESAPGVVARSGPYPVAASKIQAHGQTSDVQVQGRDAAPAAVDQPRAISGGWVRDGGVVVEGAFATRLGLHVGDQVTLGGRSFHVAGVAVTATTHSCVALTPCLQGPVPADVPAGVLVNPGLVWVTQADVHRLGVPLSYVVNLKLADPGTAPAFSHRYRGDPWQDMRADATRLAADSQILLLIGAWLLGLLAVAGLAVLAGGRLAAQTRRVGLLKAAGGTPGLVAAVLLAEYVLVALVAAAVGLAIGTLAAPLLTDAGAGLIGSAAPPALTLPTALTVTVVALGVAALATVVPVLRAARSSTVSALSDRPRAPRRIGWLIAASARLPVPLLLALRVAARRPRRLVLGVASIAVTVSGVYVLLVLNTFLSGGSLASRYDAGQIGVLRHILVVWTVILLGLAAVNALVITWATVLDNRHSSALARALGATPRQMTAALAAAQTLPALLGALLGVFLGGRGFFAVIMAAAGGGSSDVILPSWWRLCALIAATVLAVAAVTTVPARLGGRRPVAESLQAEVA